MARAEGTYQFHLWEKVPETVYRFNQGTIVYPLYSSRGVLRNPVMTRKTKIKRNGLTVYESLNRVDLYFNKRYWSLPEGSSFAAYQKKRHEIKISQD